MAKGKVIRYNEFRGWGFIKGDDKNDYFVHWSFIRGSGYKFLRPGEKVEFEPVDTYVGLQAHDVRSFRKREEIKASLKANPFTPQDPVVDPNKFAGRGEAIHNAVDSLFNNKNIMITGERGIGKSSLAYQLTYLAEGEETLLKRLQITTAGFGFSHLSADHRCVPGNTLSDILDSLASSCRMKFNQLRQKERATTEWGVDFKIFKFGRKKEAQVVQISDLVEQFIVFVRQLYDQPCFDFNGVVFLIDEIDCLPPEIPLGSFFKAASEALRFNGFLNVSFIVAGVTGAMTNLITQHPSSSRLFEITELRRMSEQELEEIILNALSGTQVRIRGDTRRRIISLADRFPEPVHLLGYHTCRLDMNSLLDMDDLEQALNFIINELKRQEFTQLYKQASGGLAEPILRTVAGYDEHEISVAAVSRSIGSREQNCDGNGGIGFTGTPAKSRTRTIQSS